jgi:hypothetical protein
MFLPALQLSRDRDAGGPAFLRLLGRAYSDPSNFIRDFLNQHYAAVSQRFFDAFQRALPQLPPNELAWRLHFSIGALSSVLAAAETSKLIAEFSHGRAMDDLQLISRLASLMVAALKAPLPDGAQSAAFAAVLEDAREAELPASQDAMPPGTDHADAAVRESAMAPSLDERGARLPLRGDPLSPLYQQTRII